VSESTLEKLVGIAITDRRFRQEFLNGGRRRLLARFDLGPEERNLLLAIQADSLEGFAAELQQRLQPPVWCLPSPGPRLMPAGRWGR